MNAAHTHTVCSARAVFALRDGGQHHLLAQASVLVQHVFSHISGWSQPLWECAGSGSVCVSEDISASNVVTNQWWNSEFCTNVQSQSIGPGKTMKTQQLCSGILPFGNFLLNFLLCVGVCAKIRILLATRGHFVWSSLLQRPL